MTRYKYRIERAKLNSMFVELSAQRVLSERHVQTIIDNFNEGKVGLLHVSERSNGTLAIVDGHHRQEALQGLGYEEWESIVYEGLTLAQEADLFVGLNETRYVAPMHKFHARATAGDPVVLDIKEALSRYGWTVPRTPSGNPGTLSAVSALLYIYESAVRAKPNEPMAGRFRIENILAILTSAWGHRRGMVVSSSMLRGVHVFLSRYEGHPNLDKESLIRELSGYPGGAQVFYGHARGAAEQNSETMAVGVAEKLTALHNKQKRSRRLPPWRG